ncbi:hypothetical protein FRC00_004572 [Tulasnella sp. 408]|nr:hypothetical protein FRC00_004572 [Tulasnella sp. 408]
MLLVPVIYDKYDKLVRFARAIREDRVHFILSSTGLILFLLIRQVESPDPFTQPGCKDAKKDPHQDLGDQFQLELGGWCQTKKAGSIFFWLAFVSWAATFAVVLKEWREGKVRGIARPRDPPFTAPVEHSHEESETSSYYPVNGDRDALRPLSHIQEEDDEPRSPFNDPPQSRYGAGPPPSLPPVNLGHGRQSMDTYGAFSDPAPTGYNDPPEPVSRTMQYADPYAVVRSSIGPRATPTSPTGPSPPSYQSH